MEGSVLAQGAAWGSDVEDKLGGLRSQMKTDGKGVRGRWNSTDDVLQPAENETEKIPKASIWGNQKKGEINKEMSRGVKQGPLAFIKNHR